MTRISASSPARLDNILALIGALHRAGITEPCQLAALLGPSMMPDRVRALRAGAALPDYLARAIEHTLGVPLHWLDEPQPAIAGVALRLLPSPGRTEPPRSQPSGRAAAPAMSWTAVDA